MKMSLNSSQTIRNERINNNSQVAGADNGRVTNNRAVKLLIGTVDNSGNRLTTNALSEKAKSAKIAGILAMAVGITLCIVATALIAGVGISLIPLAPIFVLGLAACLYGAVLTTVAYNTLSDINTDQADFSHDINIDQIGMQSDKSSLDENVPSEAEHYNPIFAQEDLDYMYLEDTEDTRLELIQPHPEAIDTINNFDTVITEKPIFANWLERQRISTNPDTVLSEDIYSLTFKQLIDLKNYNLTSMNTHFKKKIAKQIKSLIDNKETTEIEREQLIELAKLYLDEISTIRSKLYMDDIYACYKILHPYIDIKKMPAFPFWCNSEKTNPVAVLKNKIDKHEDLINRNRFDVFNGAHRDVYIEKETGIGYKIIKKMRDPRLTILKNNALRNRDDLRLNAIYKSDDFYGGKYKQYACFNLIKIKDGYSGKMIEAIMFQKIPGSKPLKANERIPHSAIKMLENMGYFPFDVCPGNFVKVFNPDTQQQDYIPIDAKFIAYKNNASVRTRNIRWQKETNKAPYMQISNIAFSK